MKRTVVLALAILSVVGVSLLVSGSAQASGDPVTIVVSNRSENVLPVGTDFRFNSPIYKLGTNQVLGTDSGTCELLPTRGDIADEVLCDTVFTFNDGSTVTASGKQRLSAPVAVGAVTGATGRFLGCDGTVTGVLDTSTPEPQDFRITLRLSC